MPTYGYRCGTCRHEFEQFQRMSDDPLTACPECGNAIKRVIHPVGVVFKGSGWYITDSRKPAGGENGAGDKATSGTDAKDAKDAKEPATAKAGEKADNGKEPAAKTAKEAKTPSKAATT